MTSLPKSSVARLLGLAALCLPFLLYAEADAAKRSKRSRRPIRKPKFDPSAEHFMQTGDIRKEFFAAPYPVTEMKV